MGDASVTGVHESPTDSPTPLAVAAAQPSNGVSPNRSKRYAVFPDGDIRVFTVARPEDHPVPVGCLMPLETAPGFQTAQEARSWLRRVGGLPQGRRLVVVKIQAILELQEVTQPVIRLREKARVLKTDLPGQAKLPFPG